MQFPDARILIFARAPQLGRVKSRLAADIGQPAALACHQALLEHTLTTVAEAQLAPATLLLTPDDATAGDWPLPVAGQGDGDLGRRMSRATSAALRGAASVLLIGVDCPTLDQAYLRQALAALQAGSDAVIGPAADGGYVLLGVRRMAPSLFIDIDWGSERVCRQTRSAMRQLDWQVSELPTLWDVDRLADYRRWQGLAGRG